MYRYIVLIINLIRSTTGRGNYYDFLLALFATIVGSLSGMGGGVIIKPLMDALGDYDVQTIGVVSSITVFTMAIVSVLKQMKAGIKIPFKTAIPIAAVRWQAAFPVRRY